MPHLHISLQAGDNMILKRMKRRHNREQVIEFCCSLRQYRPNMAFGADIIVGFPTETDEMFHNTIDLVQQADLQYLHVFPYSPRARTPAARMPQVDGTIKKQRAKILREVGQQQLHNFMLRHHNLKTEALVESDRSGHADNFIALKFNQDIQDGSIATVTLKYDDSSKMLAIL